MKVTGKENVKIAFCSYPHQKWIDLLQSKTKMISNSFCTYRRIHCSSGSASFLCYLSEIIRRGTCRCGYLAVHLPVQII